MKNLLAIFTAVLLLCLFSCKKEKDEHQVELYFKAPSENCKFQIKRNGEKYGFDELTVNRDSTGGFTGYGIYEGDVLTIELQRPMNNTAHYSGEFIWTIKWNGPDREIKTAFSFDSLQCEVETQLKIE
jgi:hypothetical protein